ncbi:hypothetical protein [Deinococcus ruber]|uniref:Uncharacterized protein n=1 Tax=Deinococcus ruber TaxID=1848197 RepID=A0A918C9P3_9DEIO|nr:hypothetical protein [Deinococcus ruber]GGR12838.1 hypothetical protein GCM10008957_27230 [Deinococcus ruber]
MYLRHLQVGGAQRLRVAQQALPALEQLIEQGYVRRLHGLLGPVVALGPLGFALLGLPNRPLTLSSATDQVALREAVQIALARGYVVFEVSSRAVRLKDAAQREHLLYVRVSRGLPSPATVRLLIKAHASTFRRSGGTLILYTLQQEKYARQLSARRDLQVWVAVQ